MTVVKPGSRRVHVYSCHVRDLYYVMRISRVPFLCGGLLVSWCCVPGACLCRTQYDDEILLILSHVYGSVTNNNGVWIGFINTFLHDLAFTTDYNSQLIFSRTLLP
jgi:hypothetical protein